MGDDCAYEPGQKPSEERASKIADYASSKRSFDLLDWGVDEETSFLFFNDHFDDSSDARSYMQIQIRCDSDSKQFDTCIRIS